MGDFRPIITDSEIVNEAVAQSFDILAREVQATAANFGPDKLKADLAAAFLECSDAYEMAKHLERCGWIDIDAETVAALETARTLLISAHRRAVRAWVQRTGLQPKHRVGDDINFTMGPRVWKGKIIEIFEQEGCYLIFSDALNAEMKPSHAPRVPWEQVDGLSHTSPNDN